MKPKKALFIVLLALFAGIFVFSMTGAPRDDQETSPKKPMTKKEMEKKQWENERKAKKQRDSALKAHMKHQTKEVRKRMKKDLKKANEFNSDAY